MAENYKHLYGQMKHMVAKYQDEILPGMRKQLEEAERRANQVSWIPVVDRLPDPDVEVLICTRSKSGSRNIDKGCQYKERWVHRGTAEVTHWMPLPEPPEVEHG